jgi:hypothetical protein
VWKADGTRVAHIPPYGVRILSAAFSPDGQYVVTGSEDKTAPLWHSDGTLVAVLGDHRGPVRSVAFSQDGAQVLTASDDTPWRVWTFQPEAVRRALWYSTRYCLNVEERIKYLGARKAGAEAAYKSCTDMVQCLQSKGPAGQDPYQSCLDAYRREQQARLYEGER